MINRTITDKWERKESELRAKEKMQRENRNRIEFGEEVRAEIMAKGRECPFLDDCVSSSAVVCYNQQCYLYTHLVHHLITM